jgi:hypothetical protein
MLGLATNGLQQPRPISGIALRLDGDDWVPWLPDPSHALFNEFRGLQLPSIGRDYAEQKGMLDAREEDIFVASFFIVQNPETGHFMTYWLLCSRRKGKPISSRIYDLFIFFLSAVPQPLLP